MSNPAPLPPGFRFHPTDEELILHYLRNRSASIPCPVDIIAEVDIYKFDPWDLPDKAMYGDKEWYFFSPRDRKYPNGIRPNRAAGSGYWKATGTDKPIQNSVSNENIGVKKALVFYKGRPPKGVKTNWIMHEYRLAEAQASNNYRPLKFRNTSMRLDDWVLCRIYKKSNQLSTVPPLVDHEQDDSSFEENSVSYQPIARIPKTCSISDFLVDSSTMAQLFDLPDMTVLDHNSILANQNLNQMLMANNNNMALPVGQIGSSIFMAENSLKRERYGDGYFEEGDGFSRLNPNKKQNRTCIDTNFPNQVNGLQQTLIGQPVYGQQLLLNSTLGMH
ncbi:hypothetical protein LUZ61_003349 [Rhynchospora tenuis]|uniref:NAC domain-containing protein n=1 Tax=Rhynchospora tenuis TaxID=198213 RepID=A0AAD5ZL34_9POAL|nr:hypothetical protein LUZ61_003349 [Rhynchospora tenuis]